MDNSRPTEATQSVVCPTCGAEYGFGARFCGKDGTALPRQSGYVNMGGSAGGGANSGTPAASPSHTKVCPACRKTFPEYAQFCPADARKLVPISGSGQASGFVDTKESAMTDRESGARAAFADDDYVNPVNDFMGKTVAGKYRIEALLGEGGMAQVFKAVHLGIEKPVVIKIMHGNLPSMKNSVKRFEVECKVTAKLNHPNLVSVFDGGVLDGRQPYLVMEYIDGESLRSKITREGQMPFATAATIMAQICAGLQEAHNQEIVHRDLKPENIMLRDQADRPDWVKVVDFGIAHLKQGGLKLTGTGIAVGTVDYMSPEYLADKPIDHRADIYALGVIFYELLTGRCPFQSESAEGTMAKHLWSTAQPPSALRQDMKPGCSFDLICEKALEKDPDKRYQSANEMKLAFQKALKSLDDVWR